MITRPRIGFLLLLPAIVALFALTTISVSAQETVTVDVGDTYFCDSSFQGGVCTTTINAGDTVAWDFGGASLAHSATDCGGGCSSPSGSPAFNSGIVSNGSAYQHTFDSPGTYAYYCQVHGASVMQGEIVVQGASQQPTTSPTTPPATTPGGAAGGATATPGTITAPTTGGATPSDSTDGWWLLALLAGSGASLTGLGALAYRMRRHT
ncbi:MAG: plastocyanin/azurin family copper-binding protein [Dehalococcoidia bacterium]